jgi:hypothetical protein
VFGENILLAGHGFEWEKGQHVLMKWLKTVPRSVAER